MRFVFVFCVLLGAVRAAAGDRVHYLANEGVLLESGQRKVVVDFPFTGSFDWCVSPTEEQVQALLQRRAPFDHVDAFLFTHDHVDHFDPALVLRALEAHAGAALVGTSLVLERVREAGGEGLLNPTYEAQPERLITLPGLTILPLRAPHAAYWDIDPDSGERVVKDDGYVHVAYQVSLGSPVSTRYLHGGDAYEITAPASLRADLVLMDRGVLHRLASVRARHWALGARRTVLMHVGPSEHAAVVQLVESEASWLTALTRHDQVMEVPAPGATCMGQAWPGAVPELFQPGRVSSPAHDMVVRFSRAMDELYLMQSSPDWFTGILRFTLDDGAWVGPELAPIPFPGSISYPFLAVDGSRIFFDGSADGAPPDLWSAPWDGEGWGPPVSLGAGVNTPAAEGHVAVAANGNLYFGSNRPGGLGGADLYCAVRTDDGYALAENLGPAVNSPEQEFHPFIAPDESYLLFDARRKDGLGGNDLYVSFRRPDGTWTRSQNLGPEINTAAGEMRPYVPAGGKVLFFCSTRSLGDPSEKPASLEAFQRHINGPGNGSQDIWWVDLSVVERLRVEAAGAQGAVPEGEPVSLRER